MSRIKSDSGCAFAILGDRRIDNGPYDGIRLYRGSKRTSVLLPGQQEFTANELPEDRWVHVDLSYNDAGDEVTLKYDGARAGGAHVARDPNRDGGARLIPGTLYLGSAYDDCDVQFDNVVVSGD